MIDFMQFACGVWDELILGYPSVSGAENGADGDSALTDDLPDFGGVV
jgi:hypothetical protein